MHFREIKTKWSKETFFIFTYSLFSLITKSLIRNNLQKKKSFMRTELS